MLDVPWSKLISGQRTGSRCKGTSNYYRFLSVPLRILSHYFCMRCNILWSQLRKFIRLRVNPAQWLVLCGKQSFINNKRKRSLIIPNGLKLFSLKKLPFRRSCWGNIMGRWTVWWVPHCGGITMQRISFTWGLSDGLTPYKYPAICALIRIRSKNQIK